MTIERLDRTPQDVRDWVQGRFEAESRAYPSKEIFVGAWDYPANTGIALTATRVCDLTNGVPKWFAFPLREAEDRVANICVELWKKGKPRIVFSNWHGVTLRSERVFKQPDLLWGDWDKHFAIENQVLLGIVQVRYDAYGELLISMAPDWEQAAAAIECQVPR
jgi:hypothetical protein